MQFIYDFLPIVIFFITYKAIDIYAATLAAIAVCVLQVGWTYFKGKKPEMSQWVSLGLIILLGGATVIFKNELFIKWKPTAVYWLFGVALLISQWVGNRPLMQRLLEKNIQLSSRVWRILNMSWSYFFITMGGLNLYIAYHFNTDTWVNFKLFGTLLLTIMFILAQAWYLSRQMPQSVKAKNDPF
ncbi:MAG: septation protein A [Gammaproteobacteria bacterium]